MEPLLSGLYQDRPDILLEFGCFMIMWVCIGFFLHYVLNWTPDNEDDF